VVATAKDCGKVVDVERLVKMQVRNISFIGHYVYNGYVSDSIGSVHEYYDAKLICNILVCDDKHLKNCRYLIFIIIIQYICIHFQKIIDENAVISAILFQTGSMLCRL
jgi:hypothetical protein